MSFDVGALVTARGREWVVLPESNDVAELLVLRPLGGSEDEIVGIHTGLETVESASFPLPDPATEMGNHLSCSLLRDAVRLGFRSGAGPFRSLARIAVEPRPYQLVPLLMALKLDPVRMLIADDVGIGKTVEACVIARELLDRGEIRRFSVLCPPHLAEQWQRELMDKFHIDAALVLSGTAARLERTCLQDESIFERYPFTVVSTDFIKSERRKDSFLRTCPELVIVDEAHTCSAAIGRAGQKRHELLQALSADEHRHMLLVTATPHSGKSEAFRSLLTLIDRELADLPEDLSGERNRAHRERLARYCVQRRRGDITAYMDVETPFPQRVSSEDTYALHADYRTFFNKVLEYCRESVFDPGIDRRRQRVRHWSALALLRSLGSSPAAAAATMRTRSTTAEAETVADADEIGRRLILDPDEYDTEEESVTPGADPGEADESAAATLRRLAREADELRGRKDLKLQRTEQIVRELLREGFSPILFTAFIPTAEYVAEHLRKRLTDVDVRAVTGLLPPDERESRVRELGEQDKRVLVCTDCLSEGVNLQHWFDAVMHYDLSYNPTRHEQREGRVDRYGGRPRVRALTYYGRDNPIDGFMLQVLLRKQQKIIKMLGVHIPLPMNSGMIEEAFLEWLQLQQDAGTQQLDFEFVEPHRESVELEWDQVAEREKKSRALFAQHRLQKDVNDQLVDELAEVRRALGGVEDVRGFANRVLRANAATLTGHDPVQIDLRESPRPLREAIGQRERLSAVFNGRPQRNAELLTRTHPVVEGLARYVMETTLDRRGRDRSTPASSGRCGVIRTGDVSVRTTLLLLRMRFHIVNRGRDGTERPLLAEDQVLAGYSGSPGDARWLEPEEIEPLTVALPQSNVAPEIAQHHIGQIVANFHDLRPYLDGIVDERAEALLDAHRRVRKASRAGVRYLSVDAHKPADVLGIFVYLPTPGLT